MCGRRPRKLIGAAAAAITAEITIAIRYASVTASGPVAEARSDTTGITASAARLAVRAIALFTPDATLTWSGLTDPMTVAVSGATNVTRPTPITIAPGRTSRPHNGSGPIRERRSSPAARMSGPAVSCRRGPICWASAPDRAEPMSISTVAGRSAVPACSAVQPAATCS